MVSLNCHETYNGGMLASLMEMLVVVALTALALMGATALFLLWRRGRQSQVDPALTLLQQQIGQMSAQQDTRLGQISEQLTTTLGNLNTNITERLGRGHELNQQSQKMISERLEAAAKTMGDLRGQLGQLDQATRNVTQVASEVRKLQDILQSPKLRGGLGEWSLDNLLAEVLPQQQYELQHRFDNGYIVDALVHLAQGHVSIDAKFPLENFQAMLTAPDDAARQKLRRAFLRDVRGRIDEIADKYIAPAEGTLDFALMYVPAENVYYEAVFAADDIDIGKYGREHKVIPVSPNTLYAYLMAIATGLRGLQIEKHAQRIHQQLRQLTTDVQLLLTDFALVGKHLFQAKAKHEDAGKKLDHLNLLLAQIDADDSTDADADNE